MPIHKRTMFGTQQVMWSSSNCSYTSDSSVFQLSRSGLFSVFAADKLCLPTRIDSASLSQLRKGQAASCQEPSDLTCSEICWWPQTDANPIVLNTVFVSEIQNRSVRTFSHVGYTIDLSSTSQSLYFFLFWDAWSIAVTLEIAGWLNRKAGQLGEN